MTDRKQKRSSSFQKGNAAKRAKTEKAKPEKHKTDKGRPEKDKGRPEKDKGRPEKDKTDKYKDQKDKSDKAKPEKKDRSQSDNAKPEKKDRSQSDKAEPEKKDKSETGREDGGGGGGGGVATARGRGGGDYVDAKGPDMSDPEVAVVHTLAGYGIIKEIGAIVSSYSTPIINTVEPLCSAIVRELAAVSYQRTGLDRSYTLRIRITPGPRLETHRHRFIGVSVDDREGICIVCGTKHRYLFEVEGCHWHKSPDSRSNIKQRADAPRCAYVQMRDDSVAGTVRWMGAVLTVGDPKIKITSVEEINRLYPHRGRDTLRIVFGLTPDC